MQESNQEPELHYRTQDTDELQTPISLKQVMVDWARVLGTGTINLSSSLEQALVDWARVLGTGTINLAKSPRSLLPPSGSLAYAALMPVVTSFAIFILGLWSMGNLRDSYYDARCLAFLCLPPFLWKVVLSPEAFLSTLVVVNLLPIIGEDAFFLACMPIFLIVWIVLDVVFSQRWGVKGRVSLFILAVVIRLIVWTIYLYWHFIMSAILQGLVIQALPL